MASAAGTSRRIGLTDLDAEVLRQTQVDDRERSAGVEHERQGTFAAAHRDDEVVAADGGGLDECGEGFETLADVLVVIEKVEGVAAAGDLDGIKELIVKAEEWARGMGALAAEIASRPGWEKALAAAGYEPFQRVLRKDL